VLACASVPGASADDGGSSGDGIGAKETSVTAGANAGTLVDPGAAAVTGAIAPVPAGEAPAGVTLRPRWIEPRRGDGPSVPDAAPSRDWRDGSRIVVHSLSARTQTAALVEEMLGRLGAEKVERRSVDATTSIDQVRFFHVGDAAMAAELGTTLEPLFGDVRVRDLTFYRPLPESGTLEIWLR